MTTHELAALLLTFPDEAIHFSVYMGGDDELLEVQDVARSQKGNENSFLELRTYKGR